MTPKEFSDFNSTFGPLRKIFPQKKFEDPKMAGEFLPLADFDHWLRSQPVLRRFSGIHG